MDKDSEKAKSNNSLILNYLKVMQSQNFVIKNITKVVSVISNKRVTLAEKAIQEELLLCAEYESFLLGYLSNAIRKKYFVLGEDNCLEIRLINIKLSKHLRAFSKAAKYNLNYLEQYFEHDFWLELNNAKFAFKLGDFVDKIKAKKH